MTAPFGQMITEVMKSVKSRAEEAFAMFDRQQDKKAREKMFKARQERAEHAAHLRGLRLAKEADLKEAADKEAAKIIKPSQLPKAHRNT